MGDAYKTPLSLIVLDDLERLMEYVRIGPRFSNPVLQALFSLLKKRPKNSDRRLLIIGTTSDKEFMQDSELFDAFNVALTVPNLSSPEHFKAVLKTINGFSGTVIEDICSNLQGKTL